MVKRILMCSALIAVNVVGVFATPADAETRTHYVIANKDRVPVLHATVITTSTENLATETYLFEDPSGQRIRIELRRNYKNRLVTADYSVNDGRPVKVKLELPGNAASRSEAISEYKRRPELRNQDIAVTVESLGKMLKTGEKEWKSGKSEVRQKAKAIAGSTVATALKTLSTVLGFPQFGGACSTYQFVSDGEKCSVSADLVVAVVRPDCAFDARLGAPCGSEQKLRAKQQPNNGKVGAY